jgi:hypothetical protein
MKKLMLVAVAAMALSIAPVLADDVKVTIAPEVDTWVVTQDGPDVVYDGDIVVGAALPGPVTLTAVPDTTWSYVKVKGKRVIVDTPTRKIVKIY